MSSRLLLLLGACALAALLAEGGLRLLGFRPYELRDASVRTASGRPLFETDPLLGYRNRPGSFEVELDPSFVFEVSHDERGLRRSRAVAGATEDQVQGPTIWILGCSFTYGWGVDDAETFPAVLAELEPRAEFVNFGTVGYGTVQSLIQLRTRLADESPDLVILAYAWFHDQRNALTLVQRRELASWNRLGAMRQPFARLAGDGEVVIVHQPTTYPSVPLAGHSAVIGLIQRTRDRASASLVDAPTLTRNLVRRMARTVERAGASFLLAEIAQGQVLQSFAETNRIHYVDISVDLTRPGFSNQPWDGHPSPRAHREYAHALAMAIESKVGGLGSQPSAAAQRDDGAYNGSHAPHHQSSKLLDPRHAGLGLRRRPRPRCRRGRADLLARHRSADSGEVCGVPPDSGPGALQSGELPAGARLVAVDP